MKILQKIWKHGKNTKVITIPKETLDHYGLQEGDKLELNITKENIHYILIPEEKRQGYMHNDDLYYEVRG